MITITLTRANLLRSERLLPIEDINGVHQFNIKYTEWMNADRVEYHAPDGTVKILKDKQ
jgi:hypothetical protein